MNKNSIIVTAFIVFMVLVGSAFFYAQGGFDPSPSQPLTVDDNSITLKYENGECETIRNGLRHLINIQRTGLLIFISVSEIKPGGKDDNSRYIEINLENEQDEREYDNLLLLLDKKGSKAAIFPEGAKEIRRFIF